MPSQPAFAAVSASANTLAVTDDEAPTASAALVSVVTPSTSGRAVRRRFVSERAARTAARSIGSPPAACTVIIATPCRAAARQLSSTVDGMSNHFKSNMIRKPSD